jgi:hypothetical protein
MCREPGLVPAQHKENLMTRRGEHLTYEKRSQGGKTLWERKKPLDQAAQFRKMAAGLIAKAETLEHEFSVTSNP